MIVDVYCFTWYDWYHKVTTLPWPCHQFIWSILICSSYVCNNSLLWYWYSLSLFDTIIFTPYLHICVFIWSWWSPAKSVVTSTCGGRLVGKRKQRQVRERFNGPPSPVSPWRLGPKIFPKNHGESTVFALKANSECKLLKIVVVSNRNLQISRGLFSGGNCWFQNLGM